MSGPLYKIIISNIAYQKLEQYLSNLKTNNKIPGKKLAIFFKKQKTDITTLSTNDLLNLLLATKEFEFIPDRHIGRDWNQDEIYILSNISMAIKTKIYDNGSLNPNLIQLYDEPLNGLFIFTPSEMFAPSITKYFDLLTNAREIDNDKLKDLFESRIIPPLYEANKNAGDNGVIIIIPAIGCDLSIEANIIDVERRLQNILRLLLQKHADKLPKVKAVIFDININYLKQCELDSVAITPEMDFITIASHFGNKIPLLQEPAKYGEKYKDCMLCSIVEWSPFDLPGNEYFVNYEVVETDAAVKTAATNVMSVLTASAGGYIVKDHTYMTTNNNYIKLTANNSHLSIYDIDTLTKPHKQSSFQELEQLVDTTHDAVKTLRAYSKKTTDLPLENINRRAVTFSKYKTVYTYSNNPGNEPEQATTKELVDFDENKLGYVARHIMTIKKSNGIGRHGAQNDKVR